MASRAFVLGIAAALCLVTLPLPCCAQGEDFGAATIETEDPKALPVELAEEQVQEALPAAAATAAESEAAPEGADNELTTVLNTREVELAALIKSFSKITKRNYIVDSNVKGKVTIHLSTPVTIAEALRLLDSVLLLKGFAAVPIGPNTWKIVPAKEARQTTIPVMFDSPREPSDALVTQLVRLKHSQASEIQQALSQFVSKEGLVTAFAPTNALIMIDSAANIERLARLVKELDVPAVDQDVTIIPIEYAEAKDVAEKVEEIIGEKSEERSSPLLPNIPRPFRTPGQASSISEGTSQQGKRALPAKVIPDERTNSIIVVADPETTAKVRAIVEQLDSKVDLSGGKFYVYRLQHADAEELADVLSSLVSGDGGGGRRTEKKSSDGSSLSRRNRDWSSRSSRTSSDSRGALSRDVGAFSPEGRTGPTLVTGTGGKVSFESEVAIAPDPSTNSLIINASRSDYLKLKEVIEQLDVKRKQVLVEATILEVSLTDEEGMGVEMRGTAAWDEGAVVGQTNWGSITDIITNPGRLNDLTIAAASTGTITLGDLTIPSQMLLINAVKANQNVNVLSSPTILTTDNQEAEIIVGENVPFVTSTSTSDVNLNNTFNQIERQDVGITLRITPQIGFGAFVNLKIFVEISNVVPTTRNDPNGPTTSIRTTETNVEVKSGQMVVTGGLMADAVTDSARGVPYWQEIPVLGNLFRRDDQNRRRTNLLVFITPRILNDQHDAREATIESRDRLEGVIEEHAAEPDRHETLHRRSIDRAFEELPPGESRPSTITPPRELSGTSPAVATRALPEEAPAAAPKVEKRVLEYRVAPKLPGESAKAAPAPRTFVVLRALSKGSAEIPYAFADRAGTLGLIVRDANVNFFQPGGRYVYRGSQGERHFVCLGRFSAAVEAAKISAELAEEGAWQELSPREVLTLGKESWLRG